jgi:hypothetical protein
MGWSERKGSAKLSFPRHSSLVKRESNSIPPRNPTPPQPRLKAAYRCAKENAQPIVDKLGRQAKGVKRFCDSLAFFEAVLAVLAPARLRVSARRNPAWSKMWAL